MINKKVGNFKATFTLSQFAKKIHK